MDNFDLRKYLAENKLLNENNDVYNLLDQVEGRIGINLLVEALLRIAEEYEVDSGELDYFRNSIPNAEGSDLNNIMYGLIEQLLEKLTPDQVHQELLQIS